MTNRCSSISSRPPSTSIEPTECRPTAEDLESRAIESERDAEREAELARHRYFESHTDEGGRCLDASSDAGSYLPMLRDDPALKDSRRTAAIDHGLVPDPLGNAIVGAVVGGVVSGVRAAAADALVPGANTTPVLEHIAQKVAVKVAKTVIKHEAKATVREYFEDAAARASERPAGPPPPPPSPAPTPSTMPAGRSSPKATSEVVTEPDRTPAPVYTPLLIRG